METWCGYDHGVKGDLDGDAGESEDVRDEAAQIGVARPVPPCRRREKADHFNDFHMKMVEANARFLALTVYMSRARCCRSASLVQFLPAEKGICLFG